MSTADQKRPKRETLREVSRRTLQPRQWDIQRNEPNVLVLDYPEYRIGSGFWRKADEILRVDCSVRDAMGLAHRGPKMVQPWVHEKNEDPDSKPVELRYRFNVKHPASGQMFIAMEVPDRYSVHFNGTIISTDTECGWWVDRSLRKLPLDPALLKVGENELTLTCNYDENHPGFEIVYVLGEFGVQLRKNEVTMTRAPQTLKLGDWSKQKLPFYSGSVTYRTHIRKTLKKNEHLFLRIREYAAPAVRVLIDGKDAGTIAWEPNEVKLTPFIEDDVTELAIEVFGTRRNSHGPLHLTDKSPFLIGPSQFISEGDSWSDMYQLSPCGLMEPPELIVRT